MKIPAQHKVISFDVKALFTNVPLDYTINLIIKRIYDNHKINTNISRKEILFFVLKMYTSLLMVKFIYNVMVWLWVRP